MAEFNDQRITARETAGYQRRSPTPFDQLINETSPPPHLIVPTNLPQPAVTGEHESQSTASDASPPSRSTPGLPVPHLIDHSTQSTMRYVVTTVDCHGRLADRSPLRILGWRPHTQINLKAIRGVLIVATRSEGPHSVTSQGHLQLPAPIRHTCRLKPGARLLVTAFPDRDLLVAYSGSALDVMLRVYHESLRSVAA